MAAINKVLLKFIKEHLMIDIKFDNFHENQLVTEKRHYIIEPTPLIYCLPHSILFTSNDVNMEQLQDKIEIMDREDYLLWLERDKK